MSKHLRAGDSFYLDIRKTPTEASLLGHPRARLEILTVGAYHALSNNGQALDISVERTPERTSSDDVRAPAETVEAIGRRHLPYDPRKHGAGQDDA